MVMMNKEDFQISCAEGSSLVQKIRGKSAIKFANIRPPFPIVLRRLHAASDSRLAHGRHRLLPSVAPVRMCAL
jgi:hypothetical protein